MLRMGRQGRDHDVDTSISRRWLFQQPGAAPGARGKGWNYVSESALENGCCSAMATIVATAETGASVIAHGANLTRAPSAKRHRTHPLGDAQMVDAPGLEPGTPSV